MRKWLIAFVVLLVFLVGGFSFVWWGPPNLRRVALGDITAAFAHDLHDYVLQHDGKLPADWTEFEKWETEKDGKTRWPAQVTARVMELLPEPDDALVDCPRYVRVIDPDIMAMEPYINRSIDNARRVLGMTNDASIRMAKPQS